MAIEEHQIFENLETGNFLLSSNAKLLSYRFSTVLGRRICSAFDTPGQLALLAMALAAQNGAIRCQTDQLIFCILFSTHYACSSEYYMTCHILIFFRSLTSELLGH